jgi:BspA type Leucine rich repeat region (6 copies)
MTLRIILGLMVLTKASYAQFTYTTNGGAITITKYTGTGGNVSIPSSINGFPVKIVGGSAFYKNSSVTSVSIPNTVYNIGGSAFAFCTALTNVNIATTASSSIEIGQQAFWYCFPLQTFNIPQGVSKVDYGAFLGSGLTNVTIPQSLTNINGSAFSYCSNLVSIAIDSNNPSYCIVSNVLYDKNITTLMQCPVSAQGVFTIPSSVTTIADGAFTYCKKLKSVVIPNSVTYLGSGSFVGCIAMTNTALSSSITTINGNCFQGCGLYSIAIPNSVTYIADYAFSGCTYLKSVSLSTNLANIGRYVFQYCSLLTNVVVPASVQNISDYTFQGCSSLQSVYLQGGTCLCGSGIFQYDSAAIYFLCLSGNCSAWNYEGIPVTPYPTINTSDSLFGVRSNLFGFNVNCGGGQLFIIEACTNLGGMWTPLQTNAVDCGPYHFANNLWSNSSAAFFRLRLQ